MKKIISIIGARPQFIKHAPVNKALAKYFSMKIIHTGQHYDKNMSDVFFSQLELPTPDYFLDVRSNNHGEMTGLMLIKIEEILLNEKPDSVLLYGDTNSTLAGALAASKIHIPVIHIEAGLRSFNKSMPEEINRIMTDHVSNYLFCPNSTSKNNLKVEGIVENVFECGDVMKDALVQFSSKLTRPKELVDEYIFATIHRPYNTDDAKRMQYLFEQMNDLDYRVVFPIHPRTKKFLEKFDLTLNMFSNIQFIDPIGYYDCLTYQKYSNCVITDSGGIQKEAYWLRIKCITIRKETEWIETLKNGWNTLLFENLNKLKSIVNKDLPNFYDDTLYGNANASINIAEILKDKI